MRKKLILSCLSLLMALCMMLPEGLVTTVHAAEQHLQPVALNNGPQKENGGNDEPYAYAYIEDGIDKQRLLHEGAEGTGRDQLAAKYSLVTEGFVTSVKNQNPYGTCWTFATMASAESGILKKTGKTFDFAELQLAYFHYASYKKADPLGLITNDGNSLPSSSSSQILDQGGNITFATYGLSSGIGFSKEASYPYTDAASFVSSGTTKACYNSLYMLRASRWFNMSETTKIKNALMNYGALSVSYYQDS